MVGHAAGPHGHVGHDVEGVVPCRLQVVDNVSRGVVADDDLIFLVVQACGSHDTMTGTELCFNGPPLITTISDIIYNKKTCYILYIGCSQMQLSKSVLITNLIQYPKPRVPSFMALIHCVSLLAGD